MSSLCGRYSSMDLTQQQGHLLARFALAQPAVMLNPEAGCFRDDLLVRWESNAGANLICFVCTSNQYAAIHDRDHSEKGGIHGNHCLGSFRKNLDLFQGDVEHRPSSI